MNMHRNYQPTSDPYTADNLDPHDKDLAWALEFGTETTTDSGQPFNTSDSSGAAINSINARAGMLESTQNGPDPDSMAGTTFLIPPWSTYEDSPLLSPSGIKSFVLFAHALFQEPAVGDGEDSKMVIVLGAEDFTGLVDGHRVTSVSISHDDAPVNGEEPSAVLELYDDAAADPVVVEPLSHWGTNLYLRMLVVGLTDETKESEAIIWLSRDGLSWTEAFNTQIQAGNGGNAGFRRIGIGNVGAPGTAWLDWVRIYNYPLADLQEQGVVVPKFPITGGRRF